MEGLVVGGGVVTMHRWQCSAVIVSAVIQSFHSSDSNNNTVINVGVLSPTAETNSQRDTTTTASWRGWGGWGGYHISGS